MLFRFNLLAVIILSFLVALSCEEMMVDSEPDEETPDEEGELVFDLRPADARGNIIGSYTSGYSTMEENGDEELPEPSHVRVVIRELDTGFKRIIDIEVPAEEEHTETVPAYDDFVIDGISYIHEDESVDHGFHLMLKHEQERGLNVNAGETTEVELVLQRPLDYVTITPPDEVVSEEEFEVEVTWNRLANNEIDTAELVLFRRGVLGVKPSAFDALNARSYQNEIFYSSTRSRTTYDPLEKEDGQDALYFQMQARIHSALIDSDNEWTGNWLFYYPNPDHGDEQITAPFVLPGETGSIDIGIIYDIEN